MYCHSEHDSFTPPYFCEYKKLLFNLRVESKITAKFLSNLRYLIVYLTGLNLPRSKLEGVGGMVSDGNCAERLIKYETILYTIMNKNQCWQIVWES